MDFSLYAFIMAGISVIVAATVCHLFSVYNKRSVEIEDLQKLLAAKDCMITRLLKDPQIPPGTLVRLKNGGPLMVTDDWSAPAIKGHRGAVSCIRFDAQGVLRCEKIAADALEIINKED